MNITVHYVSRRTPEFLTPALEEYAKKISSFVAFKEIRIRGEGDTKAALLEQGKKILANWPERGRTVVLSRHGSPVTTKTWFRRFDTWMETPPYQLHFFLGGSAGLHGMVHEKADETVCLSPLTIAHTVCRLLLYEQVYRALTLRHGIKYHKTSKP